LLEAAETGTAPLFDAASLDISVQSGPDNLSSLAAEPRVRRNGTLQYRLAAGDLLALALVSGLALAAGWPVRAAALATALCLGGLRAVNLYSVPVAARALDQVTRIGFATAAGALATATLTGQSAARAAIFALMSSAVLVMSRGLHYAIERRRVTARTRRVLLVGAGRAAQEFADRLMRHPEYGMTPVGL